MKLLIWLMLIAIGATIIRYRFQVYEFTGEWDWANTYLSSTMVAIILIGMVLIGAGAAYPFGAFDGLSGGTQRIQSSPTASK
jgi:hypothetical protein